jgi:hypothetical protein
MNTISLDVVPTSWLSRPHKLHTVATLSSTGTLGLGLTRALVVAGNKTNLLAEFYVPATFCRENLDDFGFFFVLRLLRLDRLKTR